MQSYIAILLLCCIVCTLAQQPTCKVAAVCTVGGKTKTAFKRLPLRDDDIRPIVRPTIATSGGGPASSNCKDPGWWNGEGGFQYKVIGALASWSTAAQLCELHNGGLPEYGLKDPKSQNYLIEFLKTMGDKSGFWIALSDIDVEGEWRWTNGPMISNEDKKNWGPNQPDNWQDQDCAWISRDLGYKWDDGKCDGTFTVLCERRI